METLPKFVVDLPNQFRAQGVGQIDWGNKRIDLADKIEKAIARGKRWKDVSDLPLKNGRIYVVRRTWLDDDGKLEASCPPVVCKWTANGWIAVEGEFSAANIHRSRLMPSVQVWVK